MDTYGAAQAAGSAERTVVGLALLGAGCGAIMLIPAFKHLATNRPDLRSKFLIILVFDGVFAMYGAVYASIISATATKPGFDYGSRCWAGGLIVGLTCAGCSLGLGAFGDRAVRDVMQQLRSFVAMLLILIFLASIALYSLIVGLVTISNGLTMGDLSRDEAHKLVICEVLSNWGGIIGTTGAGMGIVRLGVPRPDLLMRSMGSVVWAGMLGIFGLIASVIPHIASPILGALCVVSGMVVAAVMLRVGKKIAMGHDPNPALEVTLKGCMLAVGLSGAVFVCTFSMAPPTDEAGPHLGNLKLAAKPVVAPGPEPAAVLAALSLAATSLLLPAAYLARHRVEPLGEALLH